MCKWSLLDNFGSLIYEKPFYYLKRDLNMYNKIGIKIRTLIAMFILTSLGFLNSASAEKISNKKLSYFKGVVNVFISGVTTSDAGVFTASIKDSAGNAYTAMTAEWVSAGVEMVTMDMGTTKAIVSDDGPGKIKIKTKFSMAGQWKLTIKLTTAAGSESKSININVP